MRHIPAQVAKPNESLARNTSRVGTISTDFCFLDDRYMLAQAMSRHGGNHPGNAGADDNQIIVIGLLHNPDLPFKFSAD